MIQDGKLTVRFNRIVIVDNARQDLSYKTGKKNSELPKIVTRIGNCDVHSEYPLSNSSHLAALRLILSRNRKKVERPSKNLTSSLSSFQFAE